MSCSNCKKKKEVVEKFKTPKNRIIETDKVITWIIVGWFFLGLYGLWNIIEKIIQL